MQRRTPDGWIWLLRCIVACGVVVLITFLVWVCWWALASRGMETLLAEMRAQGRPTRWRDVQFNDVPPDLNAATHYRLAWEAVLPTTIRNNHFPFASEQWLIIATKDVAANARALALGRKAREYRRVCWIRPKPGSDVTPIPQYNNVSDFARLLQAAIMVRHGEGNDKEAIEHWRNLDHMVRMIAVDSYIAMGGAIATFDSALGSEAMARIAPELRFEGPGAITPDDARLLIGELLDVEPIKQGAARGYRYRETSIASIYLTGLTSFNQQIAPPLRPGYYRAFLEDVRINRAAAEDRERLRITNVTPANFPMPFNEFVPTFSPPHELIHEALRRRLAAMMIALSLYRHEHGKYPARLEELIPAYLAQVPMDARNEDKTPIGYVLIDAGRRPLLYSAGADAAAPAPPDAPADAFRGVIPETGVVWQDAARQP